jgi:small subunit ribosomal protein S4e
MKAHMKRLSAPRTWVIKRKATTYVVRPRPSGHMIDRSLPIVVIARDMLKFAKTASEVKYILQKDGLLINGRKTRDMKRAAGLMDLLEFPAIGKSYRILFNRNGKLELVEQKGEKDMLCSISGKTTLKGGKAQLNLLNGRNVIAAKDLYKTGDSLIVGPHGEIKDHLKLEQGATVLLIGGKQIGAVGAVEEIAEKKEDMTFKNKEGTFLTKRKFAFVIGRDKPMIDLP